MEKDKLFGIFAEAMDIEKDKVNIDTSSDNFSDWDSLGHLTFLAALDEETNGKTTEISDLTNATSLKEVHDILNKHNIQ